MQEVAVPAAFLQVRRNRNKPDQTLVMQKGCVHSAFMHDESQETRPEDVAEQLYAVVNRMLEPFGKSILQPKGLGTLGRTPPFDISKPNQHDSKAEFQLELDTVLSSLRGLDGVLDSIRLPNDDQNSLKVFGRLRSVITEKLKSNAPENSLNNSFHLIRKNVADVGGFAASLLVLLDLRTVLHDRLEELKDQEDRFWNLPYRAPDYYARAIALRLARLYARKTGKRPTFGTSGETGDPSTSYSRALREVFKSLKIEAGERSYAEWAIGQITEEDLQPQALPLSGGLLGGLFGSEPDPDIESLTDRLTKAPHQES